MRAQYAHSEDTVTTMINKAGWAPHTARLPCAKALQACVGVNGLRKGRQEGQKIGVVLAT